MAFLAKIETPGTVIAGVKPQTGLYTILPVEICEQFRQYYSSLYTSRLQRSSVDIESFLDRVTLHMLSPKNGLELKSSITATEIQRAIGCMATHKSPGPDGFPVEWYKLNVEQHGTRLMAVSGPFPLERETRQGCPLSPLLFALIMEPRSALINTSTVIEGWNVAGITEKLSLYADDMLVYLADPQSSLVALLDMVDEFGGYSV